MDQEPEEKEMAVGMSFSAPLSLTQWMQEYMRRKGLNKSDVIVLALQTLRSQEAEVAA